MLPPHGAQVQSLVGELRSHKTGGMAKKKKKHLITITSLNGYLLSTYYVLGIRLRDEDIATSKKKIVLLLCSLESSQKSRQ